jgi:hypothetical protein
LVENADWRSQREELLGNIRKLTTIVIERLEEGSKERTFSIAQVRLLGSLGLRALRLWQETLRDGRAIASIAGLKDLENRLSQKLKDSEAGGGQS